MNIGLLKTNQINREKSALRWQEINSTGKMKCCRCKNVFSVCDFREIKRGQYSHKVYNSFCNFCDAKRTAIYKNKKIQTIDGKVEFLFSNIKRRVKDKGLKVDFDKQYLIDLYNRQDGKCFYTGEPMALGFHKDKKNSYELNFHNISVDRIDSTKGYTKDNTVLCCWGINNMKQQLTVDQMFYWAEKLLTSKYSKERK